MGQLLSDIRFTLVQLRRRPLLCGAAILSLGLGIGANTTIFSYANAILLRLPPVASPGTLAEVYNHDPSPNAPYGGRYPLSYLDWKDINAQNHAFSGIAVYSVPTTVSMVYGHQRASWGGYLVSGNFFQVLGVQPHLGRPIMPDDAATVGAGQVAVLTYATWQQDFGGNPAILGQSILFNQVPYTVIGVAPPDFNGLMTGMNCQFFAPVTMADRAGVSGVIGVRSSHFFFGIGRLKPGENLQTATADLTVIQKRLDQEFPSHFGGLTGEADAFGAEPAFFRSSIQGASGLLMALAGLVLLIACFNAANLLLVQAHGRRREWSIRAALGASRHRLLRQGLTESLVLGVLAGVVGYYIAQGLAPLLLQLKPPGFPVALSFHTDPHAVIFTALLALGTGMLFGLLPAWQACRVRTVEGLKQSAPGAGSGGSWMRKGMIAAQVAACTVMLVASALCLRSLQHARQIDPGFDHAHIVTAPVDAGSLGYSGAAAVQYVQHLEDELRRVPGVTGVSTAFTLPLGLINSQADVLTPGLQPPPGRRGIAVDCALVGPGYFQASGTALLEGRDFTRDDMRAMPAPDGAPGAVRPPPPYVAVNQAMAEHFWPHQDPVGRALLFPQPTGTARATVIGVAANGKYRSLGESTRMFLFELQPVTTGVVLVRSHAPALAALTPVRARLMQLDPNLSADGVGTMDSGLDALLFPVRATSMLLLGFGTLALVLALVGLYAVIASSVTLRTREFGVRLALGATPQRLLSEVLQQGVGLALIGLAAGMVLAGAVSRAIASLLYGISSLDPVAYLATAAILVAVALAASYLPARRAARTNPMLALHAE